MLTNFLTRVSWKGMFKQFVELFEQKWLNELVLSKCIMIMYITGWCHAFVLTFCNHETAWYDFLIEHQIVKLTWSLVSCTAFSIW